MHVHVHVHVTYIICDTVFGRYVRTCTLVRPTCIPVSEETISNKMMISSNLATFSVQTCTFLGTDLP